MARKVSGGATAAADSEDQFVIKDLKQSYLKNGAPAIPKEVWGKHFPLTTDCTLVSSTGQEWGGRVTVRPMKIGTASSWRAEITTGWPAFVRDNGIVLGMDLQVVVSAPNTLTITVLRRPEAPSAAAPASKGVNSSGAAVSGRDTGTSAAASSRKRRKAGPRAGSAQTGAEWQQGTAANAPRAAGAGQSAGAAAEPADAQANGSAAGANSSSSPVLPSSTQLLEQPAAVDESPAAEQSPGLLSRLARSISSLERQPMQQVTSAGNAAAALPPPGERPAAVAEAARTRVDASGTASAASLHPSNAPASAPTAMTQDVAAAALRVLTEAAAAASRAHERQQQTVSTADGAEAAVSNVSCETSAGAAAGVAQAVGAGNPAASSRSDEASKAAAADLPVGVQPAAASSPKSVAVTCNGVPGVFHVAEEVVECRCCECNAKAERDGKVVSMAPEEFERHAGKAHCQKWRYTLQVDDGSGSPQWLGNWLRARGIVLASDGRPRHRRWR